jgi:hypothetical protein
MSAFWFVIGCMVVLVENISTGPTSTGKHSRIYAPMCTDGVPKSEQWNATSASGTKEGMLLRDRQLTHNSGQKHFLFANICSHTLFCG